MNLKPLAPLDVAGLVTTPLATHEVTAMLADSYGIRGDLRSLGGERDQNYEVRPQDGASLVLKIAPADELPAVTELQTAVLRHLAAQDLDVSTPVVVPTSAGRQQAEFTTAAGARTARLTTFVEGSPWGTRTTSPALARAIGGTVARLQTALADFTHPAVAEPVLWDLQHADRLRPLLPALGPGESALVGAVLDRFDEVVAPVLATLPRQVVHNDLNLDNVRVEADAVVAVIDFGDLSLGLGVGDLAVTASYRLRGDDPDAGAAADVVAGYLRQRALSGQESGVLYDLMLTRLAQRILIPTWRAAVTTGSGEYLTRNLRGAVTTLRALLTGDVESSRAQFTHRIDQLRTETR